MNVLLWAMGLVAALLISWSVAIFIGAVIAEGASDDDWDDEPTCCPNWGCDACTAELEASIRRHPAKGSAPDYVPSEWLL